MVDIGLSLPRDDKFWARVRAALTMRPNARPASEPAYGYAHIARIGRARMPLGSRAEDALRHGWARCAHSKVSLALLVVEIDRFSEYAQSRDRETIEEDLNDIRSAIVPLLPRLTDVCVRQGRAGFVVVLPDYALLMTRNLAKRMNQAVMGLGLTNAHSHAGLVTISSGIAVVNPSGGVDRSVVEAARAALERAQRFGLGRIEAIDLRGSAEDDRAA